MPVFVPLSETYVHSRGMRDAREALHDLGVETFAGSARLTDDAIYSEVNREIMAPSWLGGDGSIIYRMLIWKEE